MSFEPTTPAVIVLRRGDRVLVALNEEPTEEEAHDYMKGLCGAFPGVEFVVLGGVAGVAIQPGDKRPEDTEEK